MRSYTEAWEKAVDCTRAGIADHEADSFFPTMTRIYAESVLIDVFGGGPDTASDMLSGIERFAFEKGRRREIPEYVSFAAESVSAEGIELLMVSLCSESLQPIVGYLAIHRDREGKIVLGDEHAPGSPNVDHFERVPAFRAMRGLIAKSKLPWWRM